MRHRAPLKLDDRICASISHYACVMMAQYVSQHRLMGERANLDAGIRIRDFIPTVPGPGHRPGACWDLLKLLRGAKTHFAITPFWSVTGGLPMFRRITCPSGTSMIRQFRTQTVTPPPLPSLQQAC